MWSVVMACVLWQPRMWTSSMSSSAEGHSFVWCSRLIRWIERAYSWSSTQPRHHARERLPLAGGESVRNVEAVSHAGDRFSSSATQTGQLQGCWCRDRSRHHRCCCGHRGVAGDDMGGHPGADKQHRHIRALRGWLALAAISVTAIATAFLAWFARRVPEGVSGLLKRLDDARMSVEELRSTPIGGGGTRHPDNASIATLLARCGLPCQDREPVRRSPGERTVP